MKLQTQPHRQDANAATTNPTTQAARQHDQTKAKYEKQKLRQCRGPTRFLAGQQMNVAVFSLAV